MPISDELAAIYTTAPTDRYYVETIAILQANLPFGGLYLTNQRDGWTGTIEDGVTIAVFTFLPFSVIAPRAEGDSAVSLQVVIDNVSREIMDELEVIAETPREPVSVVYRVYNSDDSTVVQNDPPITLDIQSVTATQTAVSFNAGLTNLRTRPFPKVLYTTATFPGLDR